VTKVDKTLKNKGTVYLFHIALIINLYNFSMFIEYIVIQLIKNSINKITSKHWSLVFKLFFQNPQNQIPISIWIVNKSVYI